MNANFLTSRWLAAIVMLIEIGKTDAAIASLTEFQAQIEEDILIITLNEEETCDA